jgi:hypothetical protein
VERAEIEAAMARDPEVARAVERHRTVASQIRSAYDGVLEEPVPDRLAQLVADREANRVTELAARRARQAERGRRAVPEWAALAASVAVGLFVGVMIARGPAAPFDEMDGKLIARGALDEALSSQLAAVSGESGVAIGISFKDRDGGYCRSFYMHRDAPLAGLACRSGKAWQLEVLASAPPQLGDVRPASAMPLSVLHAVDATIDGEPLDAAAEAVARDAGWRNAREAAE